MNKRRFSAILSILWILLGIMSVTSAQETPTPTPEDPCKKLSRGNEVSAIFFVGVGDGHFGQKRYADAIIAYTCAIELDPNYMPAYNNRGFAHTVQRNYDTALADYNKTIELDPTNIQAYNNRGVLYTNQGNFGLAINDFTLVISLDPDYAIAYNNRALVHAAEGNYELAVADLELAIMLDPTYAEPHASLGAVYTAMASQSYQNYYDFFGGKTILPGGRPDIILSAIETGQQTGDYQIWLPFMTAAR